MNYSHITSDMVWSYSRITQFENCPYSFLLKYIKKTEGIRHFFSDYGTFMHLIIQKYLTGELRKDELAVYYLTHFYEDVAGEAPSYTVFSNYFRQGLSYLREIEVPKGKIIGVEKKINFSLSKNDFIGYIDLITECNGDLFLIDNKSRALKPRSKRAKPTKTDAELDEYLKQLYLYSVFMEGEYGILPKALIFNCFRTHDLIIEPFNINAYEKAKKWAVNTIDKISKEEDWMPDIDYFKCRYLCDLRDNCDYYRMYSETRSSKNIGGGA